MPPPVFTVGQIVAASDVNTWFVPLVAVKTADTSRASTTTLTPDPDLAITFPAAGTWYLIAYLNYEGAALGTGDMKINLTGGTPDFHGVFQGAGGSANVGSTEGAGFPFTPGTQGAGVLCGATLEGTVRITTTATVTINWAQNTSNATATIMHAQSAMMAWRIS